MSGDNVVITARVPAELRDAFHAACKAHDVTVSQVLRQAMRAYVASRFGDKPLARHEPVEFDAREHEASTEYPGVHVQWKDEEDAGFYRVIVAASGQYYVLQVADIDDSGAIVGWISGHKQEDAYGLKRDVTCCQETPERVFDALEKLPEEPSEYPGLPFKPGRSSAGNA